MHNISSVFHSCLMTCCGEQDDEAELLAELERIKAERAEEAARLAAERAAEEEKKVRHAGDTFMLAWSEPRTAACRSRPLHAISCAQNCPVRQGKRAHRPDATACIGEHWLLVLAIT